MLKKIVSILLCALIPTLGFAQSSSVIRNDNGATRIGGASNLDASSLSVDINGRVFNSPLGTPGSTNIAAVQGTPITGGAVPVSVAQGTATTGNLTAAQPLTGTPVVGGTVSVASTLYSSVAVTISGTYAGIDLVFEQSKDGGTTYQFVYASRSDVLDYPSYDTGVLAANTIRTWNVPAYGSTNFRVRATTYTSGTAAITLLPSSDPAPITNDGTQVDPSRLINGTTADITSTTPVPVFTAAPGLKHYITDIGISNMHASVDTRVDIKDGSTTLWQCPAAHAGGGCMKNFGIAPLKGSTNTATNCVNATTGAQVQCSLSGYDSVN